MSGMSLLFPFEFPMFAETFATINTVFPAMGLQTELLPHEEMQLAHLWRDRSDNHDHRNYRSHHRKRWHGGCV